MAVEKWEAEVARSINATREVFEHLARYLSNLEKRVTKMKAKIDEAYERILRMEEDMLIYVHSKT